MKSLIITFFLFLINQSLADRESEEIIAKCFSAYILDTRPNALEGYLACEWRAKGYQNPDGTINWEKLRADNEGDVQKDAELDDIRRDCDIKGATHGETVKLTIQCAIRTLLKARNLL